MVGTRICKYSQVTALRLPIFHMMKSFIASGLLKYCSTPTSEEAMVPNIIPTMSSETEF